MQTNSSEAQLPGSATDASPRGAWMVLALTCAFLLASWSLLDGYQLADSVEYMERAQALVRGEQVVDSISIRSFGFVSLIAPFFLVADWLGVEDFKLVVALVRIFQILLGLELVRVCMRIGLRVAGERAGLLAGLAIGLNPIFLQFAISPISGIAASLCIGHALLALLDRGTPSRSFRGGLWLGGAILMAYQTILVAAALVGVTLLRDRWKNRRQWFALCAGLGTGLFAAALLDRLCYGAWAESLQLYFLQNFGPIAARVANTFGFTQLARDLWGLGGQTFGAEHGAHQQSTAADVHQQQSVLFYLLHLHEMIVWPFLLMLVVGLFMALRRLRWREGLVLLALAGCLAMMSYKGRKEFRLWLPLLPLVTVFLALGWRALLGSSEGSRSSLRGVLCVVLVVAGAGLGWAHLSERNTARYSGYWDAMELVDSLAADREQPLTVSSAFHWAVFLRESAGVQLIKLPHQLDGWEAYDDAQRAEDLAAIGQLDTFITHLGVLMPRPQLFSVFAREFEVAGLFFDHALYRDLGPIVVFARPLPGATRGTVLLEEFAVADPSTYRAAHGFGEGTLLVQTEEGGGSDQLRLLGTELTRLPGDGHYWLTWHWQVQTPLTENYLLFEELGVAGEERRWRWTRQLGHGISPSSTWAPGTIVRDGFPVILAQDPLGAEAPWQPLGASSTGEFLELELWERLGTLHPTRGFLHPMLPARPGESRPFDAADRDVEGRTPDGRRFDSRSYWRAAEFRVPAPTAR